MAKKFKVWKPVEYGPTADKLVLYFPADYFGVDPQTKKAYPPPTKTMPSRCHGGDIPVDASGTITLPDDIAAQLNLGQIGPLDGSPPDTSGYAQLREGIIKEQERKGTEDRVELPGGKEKWVAGANREVTPLSTEGTLKVKGGKAKSTTFDPATAVEEGA